MIPNWFVAWPVIGLEDSLAALKAGAPGGLDFLEPSDIHVTLAFLGRYNPALLKKMTNLLKELPLAPIEITTGELVALPQPRRFSALAFTLRRGLLEANAQADKWRARICREAGAALDTRVKMLHLTIARPDRRIGSDDRDAALEWIEKINGDKTPIALRLERPRLYSWTDRTASTRYLVLDGGTSKS